MDAANRKTLVGMKDLRRLLGGVSRTTIYRRMSDDPTFPKPYRNPACRKQLCWLLGDVLDYIERAAGIAKATKEADESSSFPNNNVVRVVPIVPVAHDQAQVPDSQNNEMESSKAATPPEVMESSPNAMAKPQPSRPRVVEVQVRRTRTYPKRINNDDAAPACI